MTPTYNPPERALCQHGQCIKEAMPARALCAECWTWAQEPASVVEGKLVIGGPCWGCHWTLTESVFNIPNDRRN